MEELLLVRIGPHPSAAECHPRKFSDFLPSLLYQKVLCGPFFLIEKCMLLPKSLGAYLLASLRTT